MMGEEEFDTFFSVSYSRLVGQLYALTGDWAGAGEAVLEAYVRAWDYRSQFDTQCAPDSWVRILAWNLAGSRGRRGWRGAVGVRSGEAPRADFVEALRSLSEQQRRIVVLHCLCDLDLEQLAAESGVTLAAARAGLQRGRAALAASGDGDRGLEDLVAEVYDAANQHAHPRLTARQVREQAERRHAARRSATVGGVGLLAVAGVIVAALLAGRPSPPIVSPSAGHPTGTHRILATRSPS